VDSTVNPTLSKGDLNPEVKELADRQGSTEATTVDTDFYNPFDGTKGRAGGVYLDVEERNTAEALRAKSEGRKPDFSNPPAVAGTPLVTENHRVDNTFSNPSSQAVAPVKQVDPVSTLPVTVPPTETPDDQIDRSMEKQEEKENEARNENNENNDTTTVTL
jgi:hypothetical protein